MEENVIENMKENPKVFYDYIRKQKDRQKQAHLKQEITTYMMQKKYAKC